MNLHNPSVLAKVKNFVTQPWIVKSIKWLGFLLTVTFAIKFSFGFYMWIGLGDLISFIMCVSTGLIPSGLFLVHNFPVAWERIKKDFNDIDWTD